MHVRDIRPEWKRGARGGPRACAPSAYSNLLRPRRALLDPAHLDPDRRILPDRAGRQSRHRPRNKSARKPRSRRCGRTARKFRSCCRSRADRPRAPASSSATVSTSLVGAVCRKTSSAMSRAGTPSVRSRLQLSSAIPFDEKSPTTNLTAIRIPPSAKPPTPLIQWLIGRRFPAFLSQAERIGCCRSNRAMSSGIVHLPPSRSPA